MATVHRIIGTRCVLEILAALRGEVIRAVFQASPASEKLVRRLSTLHQMMHRMGQTFRDSGHLVSLGPSPRPLTACARLFHVSIVISFALVIGLRI